MAKKLQPVTCRVCHQAIDRNVEVENIDWIMPSKNYFYHCRCYEDWVQKKNNVKISSQENDDFWRSAAYDYLKRQLKIEVNYPKVLSQWASFVKKGMTSKGIYFTIKYFYDIQKADPAKGEGGIGIVPYIYKEATRYWAEQEQKNRGLLEGIEKQVRNRALRETIKIVPRKEKAKPKTRYSFDDIKEDEDG